MESSAPRLRALPALTTALALVVGGFAAGTPASAASGLAPQAVVASAVAPQPAGWPQFVYQGVITDKPEMDYNPTNEYIFPSVFHAGAHLADPLGEWYLYLAPHDPPGESC